MRDGDRNSQASKEFDIKERTRFNSGFAAGDDKSVRNSTNQESPKGHLFYNFLLLSLKGHFN
jgi:hypothetical protein